jgi:D-beta-D-heptose 7-phosphate kinase/D-beta-D-heptose 1-phosphate adenosyltransferase|tara:strand:- start:7629 stop:8768 length:1140 start_codon:yes stop_codon:yes gene_type:complete
MKVLVLGDIIIDKYIYGTSSRISPEAPVPVITYKSEVETLGGAGLVYENLKSLGVDVTLFKTNQPRSIKTRIICDGHYITRIDNDKHANSNVVLDEVLCSDFSKYDYVVLSDYNKGVLDESLKIIEHINKFGCKIIVDPKEHATQYKNAWLVKPNNSEFTKFGFSDWNGNIITTNASDNVVACIDDVDYNLPVAQVEVSDVTGAGDCFLAAFVYGLTKSYDYMKCLEIAIKGSRCAVQHVGTYTLAHNDIEERVIFTNGVFDIMHTGHFNLLKEARSLGDRLVVGINSDASVKRLKGNNRPVNNIKKRVEQISILPWVDEVHVFEQDTPYELIKHIAPNLIVKGGDYTVETVVGHNLADVHIIPTVDGYSTTQIIENSK